MKLNKEFALILITIFLFSSICSAQDKEKQYFPADWNLKIAAEKRTGEVGLRYSYSLFSDQLPGKPKIRFWSIDFAKQGNERDWMGLNFTTVNLKDLPWLRIGIGGSQEKYAPWDEKRESDFYLTFGYDNRKRLADNLTFEGDMEVRIKISQLKPYYYVHRTGIYWQEDNFSIGPCIYLRSKTREDFAAFGLLGEYGSKNWQIKGEVFQDDLEYRFSLTHHF